VSIADGVASLDAHRGESKSPGINLSEGLPGIEFRTDLGRKEKVHLIGISPENCNLEDLWTKISSSS